jgi:Gametolysin peptidase M11
MELQTMYRHSSSIAGDDSPYLSSDRRWILQSGVVLAITLAAVVWTISLDPPTLTSFLEPLHIQVLSNHSITSSLTLIRRRKRRKTKDNSAAVETRTVFVVRMLDQVEDATTANTANAQIQQALFGEGGSITSVRQQMTACSGGTILLEPAGNMASVVVSVPSDQASERNAWVDAAATAVAQDATFTALSSSLSSSSSSWNDMDATSRLRSVASHVVLVLPPSYPDASFLADAEVNHSISVFSPAWTISLSAYMHELGHNIMLRHAGGLRSSEAYADTTGYMGRSTLELGAPLKCYNAAQHWQLGWYNQRSSLRLSLVDRSIQDRDQWPMTVKVAAFVDHAKLNDKMAVLVQLDADTYLQFNRAKDYNVGTGMMADEIVLVRDNSNSTSLLAGLDASGVYQYKSSNPPTIVTVQVCAIVIPTDTTLVDYAVVAIDQRLDSSDGQDDDEQAEQDVNAQCQKQNNHPPSAPTATTHHFTMSPTRTPIQQPTPFVPVPTPSPVWANATNTTTTGTTSNLRQRIKDVVTFASTNRHSPDVIGIATVALGIVGVLLIGYVRCWCRRRKRRAVAEATKQNGKEENTIASFFSSVQLY